MPKRRCFDDTDTGTDIQDFEAAAADLMDIEAVNVKYHNRLVGTLAKFDRFRIAFEYDPDWIASGFSISPLSLPLQKGLFIPDEYNPDTCGLYGVFYDSLPKGFGKTVMDAWLESKGVNPASVSVLARLVLVGKTGPGALEYEALSLKQHRSRSKTKSQSRLSAAAISTSTRKIQEICRSTAVVLDKGSIQPDGKTALDLDQLADICIGLFDESRGISSRRNTCMDSGSILSKISVSLPTNNETACMNDLDDLDMMFGLASSLGGSRPKVSINPVNIEHSDTQEWIEKFPCSLDLDSSGLSAGGLSLTDLSSCSSAPANLLSIGQMEYDYNLCAAKCGIPVPEVKLLSSGKNSGYFASRRFDHISSGKYHVVTASALLESPQGMLNVDYISLLKLTLILTKNMEEVEKMYRLMCFNVFAHNQDDHTGNFSFLYDEESNCWKMAPAYDLTYSTGLFKEHSTMIHGSGNPDESDLLACAREIGIPASRARKILEQIKDTVSRDLAVYLER